MGQNDLSLELHGAIDWLGKLAFNIRKAKREWMI
jgi:hypothetical protein